MKRDRKKLLLLLCCLFVFAIQATAQGKRVTLKSNAISLPTALYEMEKQNGYYKINYNYSDLKDIQVVADINNLDVPTAVNRLITGKGTGPLSSKDRLSFLRKHRPQTAAKERQTSAVNS